MNHPSLLSRFSLLIHFAVLIYFHPPVRLIEALDVQNLTHCDLIVGEDMDNGMEFGAFWKGATCREVIKADFTELIDTQVTTSGDNNYAAW